jgi:hypothetical protein
MASTSIDADLPLVASASTRQAQRMVRLGAMCSTSCVAVVLVDYDDRRAPYRHPD